MRNSIHKYRQRDYGSHVFLSLPTHNVGDTHTQTSAEDRITRIIPHGVIKVGFQMRAFIATESHFIDENNGNDNTVNSVCFTENDTTRKHGRKPRKPT